MGDGGVSGSSNGFKEWKHKLARIDSDVLRTLALGGYAVLHGFHELGSKIAAFASHFFSKMGQERGRPANFRATLKKEEAIRAVQDAFGTTILACARRICAQLEEKSFSLKALLLVVNKEGPSKISSTQKEILELFHAVLQLHYPSIDPTHLAPLSSLMEQFATNDQVGEAEEQLKEEISQLAWRLVDSDLALRDLPQVVDHFVTLFSQRHEKERGFSCPPKLGTEELQQLLEHPNLLTREDVQQRVGQTLDSPLAKAVRSQTKEVAQKALESKQKQEVAILNKLSQLLEILPHDALHARYTSDAELHFLRERLSKVAEALARVEKGSFAHQLLVKEQELLTTQQHAMGEARRIVQNCASYPIQTEGKAIVVTELQGGQLGSIGGIAELCLRRISSSLERLTEHGIAVDTLLEKCEEARSLFRQPFDRDAAGNEAEEVKRRLTLLTNLTKELHALESQLPEKTVVTHGYLESVKTLVTEWQTKLAHVQQVHDQRDPWRSLATITTFQERQKSRQSQLSQEILLLSLEKRPDCQALLKLAGATLRERRREFPGVKGSGRLETELQQSAQETLTAIKAASLPRIQQKIPSLDAHLAELEGAGLGRTAVAIREAAPSALLPSLEEVSSSLLLTEPLQAWYARLQDLWVEHLPREQEEKILKIGREKGREAECKEMERAFKAWFFAHTGSDLTEPLSFSRVEIENRAVLRQEALKVIGKNLRPHLARYKEELAGQAAQEEPVAQPLSTRDLPLLPGLRLPTDFFNPPLSPPVDIADRVGLDNPLARLRGHLCLSQDARENDFAYCQRMVRGLTAIREMDEREELLGVYNVRSMLLTRFTLLAQALYQQNRLAGLEVLEDFLRLYKDKETGRYDIAALTNEERCSFLSTFLRLSFAGRTPLSLPEQERKYFVQFLALSDFAHDEQQRLIATIAPGGESDLSRCASDLGVALQNVLSLEGIEESVVQQSIVESALLDTDEARRQIDFLRARSGQGILFHSFLHFIDKANLSHDQEREKVKRALFHACQSHRAESPGFVNEQIGRAAGGDPLNENTLAPYEEMFWRDCSHEMHYNADNDRALQAFNQALLASSSDSKILMGLAREITRLSQAIDFHDVVPDEIWCILLRYKMAFHLIREEYFTGKKEIGGFLKIEVDRAEECMRKQAVRIDNQLKEPATLAYLREHLIDERGDAIDRILQPLFRDVFRGRLADDFTYEADLPGFFALGGNTNFDAVHGVVYYEGQQRVLLPADFRYHSHVRALGLHTLPYFVDVNRHFIYRNKKGEEQVKLVAKAGDVAILKRLPKDFDGRSEGLLEYVPRSLLDTLPYAVNRRMGVKHFWQDETGTLFGYNRQGQLAVKLVEEGGTWRIYTGQSERGWEFFSSSNKHHHSDAATYLEAAFGANEILCQPEKPLTYWIPALDLTIKKEGNAFLCEGPQVRGMKLDFSLPPSTMLFLQRNVDQERKAAISRDLREAKSRLEEAKRGGGSSLIDKERIRLFESQVARLAKKQDEANERLSLAIFPEKAFAPYRTVKETEEIFHGATWGENTTAYEACQNELKVLEARRAQYLGEFQTAVGPAAKQAAQEAYNANEKLYTRVETLFAELGNTPAQRVLFSRDPQETVTPQDRLGVLYMLLRGTQKGALPSSYWDYCLSWLAKYPVQDKLDAKQLDVVQEVRQAMKREREDYKVRKAALREAALREAADVEAADVEAADVEVEEEPLIETPPFVYAALYLDALYYKHLTYESEALAHGPLSDKFAHYDHVRAELATIKDQITDLILKFPQREEYPRLLDSLLEEIGLLDPRPLPQARLKEFRAQREELEAQYANATEAEAKLEALLALEKVETIIAEIDVAQRIQKGGPSGENLLERAVVRAQGRLFKEVKAEKAVLFSRYKQEVEERLQSQGLSGDELESEVEQQATWDALLAQQELRRDERLSVAEEQAKLLAAEEEKQAQRLARQGAGVEREGVKEAPTLLTKYEAKEQTRRELAQREIITYGQQSLLERFSYESHVTSTPKDVTKEISPYKKALINSFAQHSKEQVDGFYLEEMGRFTLDVLCREFRVQEAGQEGLFRMNQERLGRLFAFMEKRGWITKQIAIDTRYSLAPGKNPLTLFSKEEVEACLTDLPLTQEEIALITDRLRTFLFKAMQASFKFSMKEADWQEVRIRLQEEKEVHLEKFLYAENFLKEKLNQYGLSLEDLKYAVLSQDEEKIALFQPDFLALRNALVRYLFHKTECQHIDNIEKAKEVGERNRIELLMTRRNYSVDLLFKENLGGKEREEQLMQMAFLAFEEDYGNRCNAMQVRMFRSLLVDNEDLEAVDAVQARMGFGKTALLPLLSLVRVAIERVRPEEARHLVRYVVPKAVIEDNTSSFNRRLSHILGSNVFKDREFSRYHIDQECPLESLGLIKADLERRLHAYREARRLGHVLIQVPEIRGSMEAQELDFAAMILDERWSEEELEALIDCKRLLGQIRSMVTYTVFDELDDTQDFRSREVNYTQGNKTALPVQSILPLEKLITFLAGYQGDMKDRPALARAMLEVVGIDEEDIGSEALITYLTDQTTEIDDALLGVLSRPLSRALRRQEGAELDSALLLIRALLTDSNMLALAKDKQPNTHFGVRFEERQGERKYFTDPDSGSALLLAVPYEGTNTPKGLAIFDNTEAAAITTLRYYLSPETALSPYPHLDFLIRQTREKTIPDSLNGYLDGIQDNRGFSLLQRLTQLTEMLDEEEILKARQEFYNDFMQRPEEGLRKYLGAAIAAVQIRADAGRAKSDRYERGSYRNIEKGCSGTVGTTSSYFYRQEQDPAADAKLSLEIMGREENGPITSLRVPGTDDYLGDVLTSLLENAPANTRAIVDAAGMCKSRQGTPEAVVEQLWIHLKAHPRISGIEGIVYYGRDNVKRLYRGPLPPIECTTEMEENALASKKYFSFYGQKNTRGSDIKQANGAHALVTLDKNVTNSDAKQAVLRFRNLVNRDSGQTFSFALLPDFQQAIYESLTPNRQLNVGRAGRIEARDIANFLRLKEKEIEQKDSLTIFRKEMAAHVKQLAQHLEHEILAQHLAPLEGEERGAYREFLHACNEVTPFIEKSLLSLYEKYGVKQDEQATEEFIETALDLAYRRMRELFRAADRFAEAIEVGVVTAGAYGDRRNYGQNRLQRHFEQDVAHSVELFGKRYKADHVQVTKVNTEAEAVAEALAEAQAQAEAQAEALAERLAETIVQVLDRQAIMPLTMSRMPHLPANLDFLHMPATCQLAQNGERTRDLIYPPYRASIRISPQVDRGQLISPFILLPKRGAISSDNPCLLISQEEADLFVKERDATRYILFDIRTKREVYGRDELSPRDHLKQQFPLLLLEENDPEHVISRLASTEDLRECEVITNVHSSQLLPRLEIVAEPGSSAPLEEGFNPVFFGVHKPTALAIEMGANTERNAVSMTFQREEGAVLHASLPINNSVLTRYMRGVFEHYAAPGKLQEVGRRLAEGLERDPEYMRLKAELERLEREVQAQLVRLAGITDFAITPEMEFGLVNRDLQMQGKPYQEHPTGAVINRAGQPHPTFQPLADHIKQAGARFIEGLQEIQRAQQAVKAVERSPDGELILRRLQELQDAFTRFISPETLENAGDYLTSNIRGRSMEDPTTPPFDLVYGRILGIIHSSIADARDSCTRTDCRNMFATTLPNLLAATQSVQRQIEQIQRVVEEQKRAKEALLRMTSEHNRAGLAIDALRKSEKEVGNALSEHMRFTKDPGTIFDRLNIPALLPAGEGARPAIMDQQIRVTIQADLPDYRHVVASMSNYHRAIHALTGEERRVLEANRTFLGKVLECAGRVEERPGEIRRAARAVALPPA